MGCDGMGCDVVFVRTVRTGGCSADRLARLLHITVLKQDEWANITSQTGHVTLNASPGRRGGEGGGDGGGEGRGGKRGERRGGGEGGGDRKGGKRHNCRWGKRGGAGEFVTVTETGLA